MIEKLLASFRALLQRVRDLLTREGGSSDIESRLIQLERDIVTKTEKEQFEALEAKVVELQENTDGALADLQAAQGEFATELAAIKAQVGETPGANIQAVIDGLTASNDKITALRGAVKTGFDVDPSSKPGTPAEPPAEPAPAQ